MLLRQLVDYAERLEREDPEGRLPPRYQKVGIRWIINLDHQGRFLSFDRTTNGLEGKKEKPKQFVAPDLVKSVNVRAKLLADNGEYVLGIERENSPPKKVRECHETFKEDVHACAEATVLSEVWAVVRFLETLDLEALELPEGFDPGEKLTFSVEGTMPIDLPEVRVYWAKNVDSNRGGKGRKRVLEAECLISGEYGPVIEREPVKIKGGLIPGGQTSGMNLISANERAYESYGLSASQVAPVKVEYAEKYANALNRLLKDDHTHLRVGPTVYIFWTKEAAIPPVVEAIARPDTQNPMLAALFSGQPIDLSLSDRPEQVKKEFTSPWVGREFEAIRDDAFYAVSLSASGGRVVVRDHLTTTVGQVKEKLRDYFEAQRMVDSGSESGRPLGVYALAASLYRDANKEMIPAIPVHLLEFALHGTPLPFAFLQQLVRRNQIERRVTRPRAVLTKIVLISIGKEMIGMERRNTDRPEIAYHLGRLLAILEKIQKDAQPGINATIVDRFYGSASTTPAWVFGRLISGAQNNLGKLRKSRPAVHTISEKRLQEVLAHIQDFPPVLKVEDQALFGLGYYHEKAYHWEQIMAHAKDKKTSAEQAKNEHPES